MSAQPARGLLEVISGPMFSGKTDALIARLAEAEVAGQRVCALMPLRDSRCDQSSLASHSGKVRAAHRIRTPSEAYHRAQGYDVVGIDEVQFVAASLAGVVGALRARGVRVLAAGLDLDFLRRPFASTARLIELADAHERRTARCGRCGAAAPLTQRLVSGLPAPADDPLVRIGSGDLYEPRCIPCYEAEEPTRPPPRHADRVVRADPENARHGRQPRPRPGGDSRI